VHGCKDEYGGRLGTLARLFVYVHVYVREREQKYAVISITAAPTKLSLLLASFHSDTLAEMAGDE
jgi:hypothetical protein